MGVHSISLNSLLFERLAAPRYLKLVSNPYLNIVLLLLDNYLLCFILIFEFDWKVGEYRYMKKIFS